MRYQVHFSDEAERSLRKLKAKDPVRFLQVVKKLDEIIDHPEHYKPLRNELAGIQHVHIGSKVLKFSVDHNIVRIIDLRHHDDAYR